jgi:predicted enzyme related to lactoylglutathione lyase
MALWVHSSAVAVSDRRRAAEWYHEVLGFTILDDDPEHWTTVGFGECGARIHLCEVAGRKSPPKASEVGDTGILLLCEEPLRTLYRKLSRRGVRFSMPPKEFPWGSVAKFLDPDGNEFWLMPVVQPTPARKPARRPRTKAKRPRRG